MGVLGGCFEFFGCRCFDLMIEVHAVCKEKNVQPERKKENSTYLRDKSISDIFV